MTSFNLEQAARELTESIAKGPPLSSVSLAEARKAVEAAQSASFSMPDVDEWWVTVSSAFGDFEVRIVRPQGSTGPLPAILYLHGGGYVIGTAQQDDRLCRGFSARLGITVASVDYRLAPEHPYPAPLEDCYSAMTRLAGLPAVDRGRIAIGGASAGGGLAAALALLARDRGEVTRAAVDHVILSVPLSGIAVQLVPPFVDRQIPSSTGVGFPKPSGCTSTTHKYISLRPGTTANSPR